MLNHQKDANRVAATERRAQQARLRAERKAERKARVGPFGALTALAVFGAYVAAQMAVWVLVGTAAVGGDGEVSELRLETLIAPGIMLSFLAAPTVAFLVFRQFAEHAKSAGLNLWSAIGFRKTELYWYGLGASIGFLISISVLLVSTQVSLPEGHDPGILERAAQTPGLTRYTWAFVALVLAPPAEETLFRGAMLEGLRRSWGVWVAGSVVTVLFLCVHMPQAFLYWPAGLGLTAGAVSMLLIRLRSGSLGPSIILHLCYNSLLVTTVFLSEVPT